MTDRNFTATVKEIAGNGDATVPAIALEPHRVFTGLPKDGILIVLGDDVSIEDARQLARELNRLGCKLAPL